MHTPASVRRRRSQVFVEIPPSPFHSSTSRSESTSVAGHTPFKAVPVNVDSRPNASSSSAKMKRKAPDDAQKVPKDASDVQLPRPKKPKTENALNGSVVKKNDKTPKEVTKGSQDAAGEGDASSSKTPPRNCHQCARTMEPDNLVQCTFRRPKGQRCVHKYCRPCMRNRYGRDIDEIKKTSPNSCPKAERAKYAEGVDYLFQCPYCSDVCNCRFCMRRKGLPATGNLNLIARKAAKEAAEKDAPPEDDPVVNKKSSKAVKAPNGRVKVSVKGSSSKGKPHILVPAPPYKNGSAKAGPSKKPRVSKPEPAPVVKPLPEPLWTALSTTLTFDGALERINIREFLLRFAHLCDVAKTHLEELEELATTNPYLTVSDDASDDSNADQTDLVGWVSENALKAILVGLLTVLSKDEAFQEDDAPSPAFVQAIQQVRASGVNLNKMWAALDTLRTDSAVAIPDPLPPPAGARLRSTRLSSSFEGATTVACTAQLVPVVAALCQAVLFTEVIRDDFERAAVQEKELAQAARELKARENTRWKNLKAAELDASLKSKSKGKGKEKAVAADKPGGKRGYKLTKEHQANVDAARPVHEAKLAALEHAHALAGAECVPRFAPLGRDADGRVYFAVTPGVVEREAALDLLEGGQGTVRFGRRRGVVDEDERKTMRHWSWFLAIWGRKPEGAAVAKVEDDDETEDEDDEEDEERWWGFWDPTEVAKLAEWHAVKHGFDLNAKRVLKADAEAVVVDGGDANLVPAPVKKGRGRPSNVSSASSSRARTVDSSDEEDDDHGDGDTDEEGDMQMRVNERGEPMPTRRDLRKLARGLKDYGELLEWRIKRATKEVQGGEKSAPSDKGKGVDKAQAIAPATFYG